ncbi:Uncharacterised protein [Vibrio cholerae]|nr:Uncharacterised protein [Vibrio cholerae]
MTVFRPSEHAPKEHPSLRLHQVLFPHFEKSLMLQRHSVLAHRSMLVERSLIASVHRTSYKSSPVNSLNSAPMRSTSARTALR